MFRIRIAIILLLAISVTSISKTSAQKDTASLINLLETIGEPEKAQVYCQLAEIVMLTNVKIALDYADKAYKIAKQYNNTKCLIHATDILANLHLLNNNLKKSEDYYLEEIKLLETEKDSFGLALSYYNLGKANYVSNKIRKAIKYFETSQQIASKRNLLDLILKNNEILFTIHYNEGKYKDAFFYFKDYVKIKDSTILTKQKNEYEVLMRNFSYSIDTAQEKLQAKDEALMRKDSTLSVLSLQKDTLEEVSKAQGEEIKTLNYEKAYQQQLIDKQRMQRNFLVTISIFVLFLLFGLYSRFLFKKKANAQLLIQNNMITQQKEEIEAQRDNLEELNHELEQQKEEIIAQRDELQDQKLIIEHKNDNITASIRYAKRIQTAALPSVTMFENFFKDYFILFKPRDIVSGDFYWLKKVENRIFVTVADCTGHGVPGAFVSMLGISMLNEVCSRNPHWNAAQVLNQLRILIKTSLNQNDTDSDSKDGMDMALCVIEPETKTIHFSGANNPLFLVRDNELMIYKASRNPVAVYIKEHDFENYTFKYQENDMIYLFSDGFPDQFGGSDAQKYKISRFKTLISEINRQNCSLQMQAMEKELLRWMGNTDQIDDITVLGIRL
jgi:serine phosphatase RsbU (regulator of sigma subunit)